MQQITFIEPLSPQKASSLLKVVHVSVTSDLLALLAQSKDIVIAYSLSGGKDCRAMVLEGDAFLDDIGFIGERVCIRVYQDLWYRLARRTGARNHVALCD